MSALPEDRARLLDRCLAGDEQAWEELVHRYRGLIYSVPVRWFNLAEPDASEIFQDTCRTLVEKIETIRKSESLPFWLLGTAANLCRVHLAREARRRSKLAAYAADGDHSGWPPHAEAAIAAAEVREAFEKLDPACRLILEARYYRQPPLSYQEIAERIGIAPGSVGPQRARCLEKLLNILEGRRP